MLGLNTYHKEELETLLKRHLYDNTIPNQPSGPILQPFKQKLC